MSANDAGSHTVVIGAGIVGVATALWLQRAGRRVTLVDRQAPGEGTSYGNAGVLASCAVVPVTTPGLVAKAPKYVLDPEFPFFMRWSYLPKLAPWLYRYLSFANATDTPRIAERLNFIIGDSVAQHQDLAGNTQADKWLVPSEYQFAYRNRSEFDSENYVWSIRREHGFVPEFIEGDAVAEKEPALSKSITCLAVLKDHAHVLSPGLYVKSLADVFLQGGGDIRCQSVQDLEMVDGQVTAVQTDDGAIACDSVVLAMGAWSGPIARKLGLKIPMEAERGYHVMYKNPSQKVSCPTMISSGKFVATPMQEGMRCAGVVEFGGLEAGPSDAPIQFLRRKFKEVFPDVTFEDSVEWLGHRPAPTDSLPFIGQIGSTGVYTGFGHQHVGLTGGAKTGRILAELIAGERDESELTAFRPDRFS